MKGEVKGEGYWNPQRKIGIAAHFFEIISLESQKNAASDISIFSHEKRGKDISSKSFLRIRQSWLGICYYSGIPGLSTGLLNLIWSQMENFAFILVVYLVAKFTASMSIPARAWRLNRAERSALLTRLFYHLHNTVPVIAVNIYAPPLTHSVPLLKVW